MRSLCRATQASCRVLLTCQLVLVRAASRRHAAIRRYHHIINNKHNNVKWYHIIISCKHSS